MKQIGNTFIFGVGIGTLISFCCFLGYGVETVSVFNIGVISILSGLIGIVSYVIFDVLSLDFRMSFLLHYIIVLLIIMVMNGLCGFTSSLLTVSFIVNFTFAYLLVWGILYYLNHVKVTKINEKLKELKDINRK